MTLGVAILVAVVWLSIVALAALLLVQRSPKRRKPVDELEAADQALRGRLVDLEDRLEHFVKRQASRGRREEEPPAQLPLPDKNVALLDLTRRARAMGLK